MKHLYFQFKFNSYNGLFNELDIINILKQRYTINDKNLLFERIKLLKVNDEKLIQLFNFKMIGKDPDGYNYMRLFEITNTNIIEIIMNLEHEQLYDKSTDKLIVLYYIDILDEYEKYINISYSFINNINPNKIALLNDNYNQCLIINKYEVNIYDFLDHDNFGKEYYDVLFLYFDYDLYLKDNFDTYINKIRNLFNNTINIDQLQKTFKNIYCDNDITNYVNYEIIDN